jgi:hypothetical protein
MSETHEDDIHATVERGGDLFRKELVYGSSAIVAIIIFTVLYIVIKNYFDRRARDAAQRELDEAQRAREAAYKQARYEAQRERVTVSTYDTSNPPQFDQNECVICLEEFENTQTYHSLPCGHIFCEECMSPILLNSDKCPICRVKILN